MFVSSPQLAADRYSIGCRSHYCLLVLRAGGQPVSAQRQVDATWSGRICRTDVAFEHLLPTTTQTGCPYKGVTSGYWSVRIGDEVRDGDQDLAWAYDFPTRQLQPIAGLVAFYNEKIDLDVDGLRPGPGPTSSSKHCDRNAASTPASASRSAADVAAGR